MPESQFDPFDTSPLYDLHKPRWELETDVGEGITLDVLQAGTYLTKFAAENAGDYAYRKDMSVSLDMCRDARDIRIDNIFRKPPERITKGPNQAILESLIADADNHGTTLDTFMRRALTNYYTTGCDIVTQMSAAEGELETRQDEIDQNIRPFFLQFAPLERFDWDTDGSRTYIWVRYSLGEKPRVSEMVAATDIFEFLTLTDTHWFLHSAQREAKSRRVIPGTITTLEGEHNLGIVPVARLNFADSEKPGQAGIPLSLLTRSAVIAKVLLNLKGQADADLLAAVTRWWVTGVNLDEEIPDAFGPTMLLKFQNADAKLGVSQGAAEHIKEKREWIMLYISELLRLLKFRGGMAEVNASQGSGLKLKIERTDIENELRATAHQMEATETEMMRQAVVMATGKQIAPEDAAEELGFTVRYNTNYTLEPAEHILENLERWATKTGFLPDTLPTIGKVLVRQLVGAIAREGTDEFRAMMEELEAADFSVVSEPADVTGTE